MINKDKKEIYDIKVIKTGKWLSSSFMMLMYSCLDNRSTLAMQDKNWSNSDDHLLVKVIWQA